MEYVVRDVPATAWVLEVGREEVGVPVYAVDPLGERRIAVDEKALHAAENAVEESHEEHRHLKKRAEPAERQRVREEGLTRTTRVEKKCQSRLGP